MVDGCMQILVASRCAAVLMCTIAVGTLLSQSFGRDAVGQFVCVFGTNAGICSAVVGIACTLLASNVVMAFVESWVGANTKKKRRYLILYDLIATLAWFALFLIQVITWESAVVSDSHAIRAAIAFSFLACLPCHVVHLIVLGVVGQWDTGDDTDMGVPYTCYDCDSTLRDFVLDSKAYAAVILSGVFSLVNIGVVNGYGDSSSAETSCLLGRNVDSDTACNLVTGSSATSLVLVVVLLVEGGLRFGKRRLETSPPALLDALRVVLAGGLAIMQGVTFVLSLLEWRTVTDADLAAVSGAERYAGHAVLALTVLASIVWIAVFIVWLRQAHVTTRANTKETTPLSQDQLVMGSLELRQVWLLICNTICILCSGAVLVTLSLAGYSTNGGTTSNACGLLIGGGFCVPVLAVAAVSLAASTFIFLAHFDKCFKLPACIANEKRSRLLLLELTLSVLWLASAGVQIYNVVQHPSEQLPLMATALTCSVIPAVLCAASICLRALKVTSDKPSDGSVSNWHFLLLFFIVILSSLIIGLVPTNGYVTVTDSSGFTASTSKCIFNLQSLNCTIGMGGASVSLLASVGFVLYVCCRLNRAAGPFTAAVFATLSSLIALGVAALLNYTWWGATSRSELDPAGRADIGKHLNAGAVISVSSLVVFVLWLCTTISLWQDTHLSYDGITRTVPRIQGAARTIPDTGSPSGGIVNPQYANQLEASLPLSNMPRRVRRLSSTNSFSPVGLSNAVGSIPLPRTSSTTDPMAMSDITGDLHRIERGMPGEATLVPGQWNASSKVNTKYRYCQNMQDCWTFVGGKLGLDGLPDVFDHEHDHCYCSQCYGPHSEGLARGAELYKMPAGWCRFGLNAKTVMRQYQGEESAVDEMFGNPSTGAGGWPVAYHGTFSTNVWSILNEGRLLKPGDKTKSGDVIGVVEGHFGEHKQPAGGFDYKKVFLSPSIRYCAEYCMQEKPPSTHMVAFQARVIKYVREHGRETLRGVVIENDITQEKMEWSLPNGNCAILYGLLVRCRE